MDKITLGRPQPILPRAGDDSWRSFLTDHPPGSSIHIGQTAEDYWGFETPREIEFHCQRCAGPRYFQGTPQSATLALPRATAKIDFTCRNCNIGLKAISLIARPPEGSPSAREIIKYGEWPPFGPPLPARVLRIFEEEKQLLLKGRRAENQGLGIGAFAYYRRALELQRARLMEQIIKAARLLEAPPAMIQRLEELKDEWRFSRSVEEIRDAIPAQLMVQGHNPLSLLHTALSAGLHGDTDEECLEVATSVRVIMTNLAERLAEVLEDHAELKNAVSLLLKREEAAGDPQNPAGNPLPE